jgi:hypothetical protein
MQAWREWLDAMERAIRLGRKLSRRELEAVDLTREAFQHVSPGDPLWRSGPPPLYGGAPTPGRATLGDIREALGRGGRLAAGPTMRGRDDRGNTYAYAGTHTVRRNPDPERDRFFAEATEAAREVVRKRTAGTSALAAERALRGVLVRASARTGLYEDLRKVVDDILREAPAPAKKAPRVAASRGVPLSAVPMGGHVIGDFTFLFGPSRWSTGKVSVQASGRALGLLRQFKPTYSHRAGYSLSPAAALKFMEAARLGGAYVSPADAKAKKVADAFNARALAEGRRLGGVAQGEGLLFQTKYGPMRMSPHGSWIAQQFTNREGPLPYGASRPSGKWNFGSDIPAWSETLSEILVKSNPHKNPHGVLYAPGTLVRAPGKGQGVVLDAHERYDVQWGRRTQYGASGDGLEAVGGVKVRAAATHAHAHINPAKYVYVLTILNSPHKGEAAGRRELGEYGAHRGIYWTEAAAKKALRTSMKEDGEGTRYYKTRVERRPATAFERLELVRDAATITYPRNATWEQSRKITATRGRFTVYLNSPSIPGGEVLARFPTRKRADVFAKHAEAAYGKGTVWVEAPGSIESKLRRMSEEDE